MGRQNRDIGETVEKERRALELATEGLTFEAIADALGYATASGAWRAVQRGLRRTVQPAADEYRRLELRRIDGLLCAIWPRAVGDADVPPDYDAVDRVLKLMQRRAKLLGLDAPVKFSIEKVVADVAEELGMTSDETAATIADLTAMLSGRVNRS